MKRVLVTVLLAGAVAQAATISTTLTVTADTAISGQNIVAKGTASLTNIGAGGLTLSGTFAATASLASATIPFTITLSGGGGTITGELTIANLSDLVAGTTTTASGSATVTGGTGPYAGATGSFQTLTGPTSGSLFSTLTLTFSGAGTINTSGTAPPPGTVSPTITAVLDGASYSANVAQGSVFIVKGSNLSSTGFNQAGFPLPATLNNSKITFAPAAGGTSIDAYMVYTCNTATYGCVGDKTQLAAVLPSTVPTGTYNVTVSSGGTASAAFRVTVVQRKPTLITRDSSGGGLAVIQIYTSSTAYLIDSFTNVTAGTGPAHPGSVLVAWSTGLGPVAGSDNTASPGFNFPANGVNVQAIVGGMNIAPDYAGRAPGLAGADQINFTLPANVPTGCTVSFQLSVNGVLSNPTFIAIAPDASSSACVSPSFSTAQLQSFDQGKTYTAGGFTLSRGSITAPSIGSVTSNGANGSFTRYSGFQLAGFSAQVSQGGSSGACQVFHATATQSSTPACIPSVSTSLDAGTVTLNGPSGSSISNLAFKRDVTPDCADKSISIIGYSLTLATEGLSISGVSAGTGNIVAGTYTVSGAGGKDVGAFNASLTLGPPLTVTGGLPATVNRAGGLTLNWTGGNASDQVQIVGSSSTVAVSGANTTVDGWTFICTTTADQRTFTVPSSILLQLPAVAASSSSGGGSLSVSSSPTPVTFTAPLTAGGSADLATFIAVVSTFGQAVYQ
jgi:uncharacterized protein (TIGR03437 family)